MLTLSNAILVAGLTCCQLRSEPRIRQREPIKRTDAKLVGVVGFEPASPASRTRLWASAESGPHFGTAAVLALPVPVSANFGIAMGVD
jgi:hypothetical protein